MTILIDTGEVPASLRGDDLAISLRFPDARLFLREADLVPTQPFSARIDVHNLKDMTGCVYTVHTFGCPPEILTDSAIKCPTPLLCEESLARMLRPVCDAFGIDLPFTRIQDDFNSFIEEAEAEEVRLGGDVGEAAQMNGLFDLDLSALRTLSFHRVIEAHEMSSLIVFLRNA